MVETCFPIGSNYRELAQELIEHYPPITPGFHRIELFKQRVYLTLCFGDAQTLLPKTDAQVDAWFLDGFSPAKNPQLWNKAIYQEVVRLSDEQASFSTYTAASSVKRGLEHAGFAVKKAPGFGKKREMLSGKLKKNLDPSTAEPKPAPHHAKPWFVFSPTHYSALNKHCIVIGSGLAGSACAYSMAKRGWTVEVLEREAHIAAGASGNPVGILFTKLSGHNNAINRFNQFSYQYALQHIYALQHDPAIDCSDLEWDQCGVLQLGFDAKEIKRQQDAKQSRLWPDCIAQSVDSDTASSLCNIKVTQGGLFFPSAGWVNPASLCHTRLSHPNITVTLETEALTLNKSGGHINLKQWQVISSQQARSADLVIVANAKDALHLEQTKHLPLRTLRGQISYLPATQKSQQLKTVLCYQGYTAPSINDRHCIGATFHPNQENTKLCGLDHQKNLDLLQEAAPDFHRRLDRVTKKAITMLKGRAQLRCQTPDYLPVVGPVPDYDFFLENYGALGKGMLRNPFSCAQYEPNLFASLGHGSKGITSSAFSAEIIADLISGAPKAIDNDVLHAIHPGRFLIRDIKRRTV